MVAAGGSFQQQIQCGPLTVANNSGYNYAATMG
jgi:hypothetical protein